MNGYQKLRQQLEQAQQEVRLVRQDKDRLEKQLLQLQERWNAAHEEIKKEHSELDSIRKRYLEGKLELEARLAKAENRIATLFAARKSLSEITQTLANHIRTEVINDTYVK